MKNDNLRNVRATLDTQRLKIVNRIKYKLSRC